MRDAHHRPLAGRRLGSRAEGWQQFWSGRMRPDLAWACPYIELARTGSSYTALVLDCDDPDRLLAGGLLHLPVPSWATWHGDRGCHAVWVLASPVHRYPHASPRPLQLLARVESYYILAAGADPGFVGVLADNPISPDVGRRTRWGVPGGHTLADLAEVIPYGWRRPVASEGPLSRHVALFEGVMKWAGYWHHRDLPVLDALASSNAELPVPVSWADVKAMSKVIERYRATWRAHGWHCPHWIARQADRGRLGGVASGRSRRLSTADRDKAIVAAVRSGQGIRSVAREHALHHSTILRIVDRVDSQLSLFEAA